MRYSYPCRIARDGEGWSASFPDVPEAVMSASSLAEALDLAEEALVGALAGYVEARWTLPPPGAPGPGQVMVAVPPLVAAKLALYAVMQRQRITKVELARRLGVSDTTVHRIVDPEHRSHIDQVERALRAVGRTLVVDDCALERGPGDAEDYYLAADVLQRIRKGDEQVHASEHVRRDLGLDD